MAIDVTDQPRRVQYVGSGTGPYAFTFEVFAASDLAVYKDATLLVLTTDYTVSLNANGTGSISTVSSMTGFTVTIVGARAYERITDYSTGGDFLAATVNDELDSFIILLQQLRETLTRTLKLPTTTTLSGDAVFPNPEANKFIGWNGTATALANLTFQTVGALAVSSYIETLLNDATAAEARTTLGSTTIGDALFIAATAAAARTTLGATTVGNAIFVAASAMVARETAGVIVKRKTADESVNSGGTGVTLQNDDHLTFAIAANEEWIADFFLDAGDALITTGLQVAVTTPAGATQHISAWNSVYPAASGAYWKTTSSGVCGLAWVAATNAANWARIHVSVWVLNGATPGNVTLQFAQQTASVLNTTLIKGSHMVAHRIA